MGLPKTYEHVDMNYKIREIGDKDISDAANEDLRLIQILLQLETSPCRVIIV